MEHYYSSLLYRYLCKSGLLLSLVVRLLCFWWPTTSEDAESHPVDVSAQAVRDTLRVAAYEDLSIAAVTETTCAVCLTEVGRRDTVWELRNCLHVFHKGCLDRWLDHDENRTCPLCRAPLLTAGFSATETTREPSWAVERLLYLFGDDLLSTPPPY